MNNDETKKKVVEILSPVLKGSRVSCNEENACEQCWFPCEIERTADKIADALIAAGIGDVKAVREIGASAAAMAVFEAAKAKHRAEVTERALHIVAREVMRRRGYADYEIEHLAKEIYIPEVMKQAEKELAEERKDD